jgi:Uma2 family endonuclease
MVDPALQDPVVPARWTAEQYLRLVDEGVLGPDDRVELLEGVIVSMAPQNVPHAAGVTRATRVLTLALADRALVRPQLSFIAGKYSVPEPDIAVIAGGLDASDEAHPRDALLVVEVSDSSLKQDRLTKAPMYAAANLPEYWIVNLRDGCVEVRRDPDPKNRRYRSVALRRRGEVIEPIALPGVSIAVDDLLPTGVG